MFRFSHCEAGFVNFIAALFHNIFGDLEWQTQGGFEIECAAAGKFAPFTYLSQHGVELNKSAVHRAMEAFFLQGDAALDAFGIFDELGIVLAHDVDD